MSIVPFGRRSGASSDAFAIDLWEPFAGFPLAGAGASSFFDSFALDLWSPFDSYPFDSYPFFGTSLSRPSSGIEWKETPEAHFFRANLPGVPEEEVQVEVEGQALQISGGQFLSRFLLPDNAKVDHLRAGMEHGVLIVMVPKVEGRKPSVGSVEISG